MESFFAITLFSVGNVDITVAQVFSNLIAPTAITATIMLVLRFGYALLLKSSLKSDFQKKQKAGSAPQAEEYETALASIKEHLQRVTKSVIALFWVVEIIIGVIFIDAITPSVKITGIFTRPFFKSGNTSISVISIFLLFLLVYISNFMSVQIKRIASELLGHQKRINARTVAMFSSLLHYSSLFIAFLIGLPIIGIDVSSLMVIFGALGIGIGFGLQDFISNYVAGISMNLSNIISEGDRVIIDNVEGDVQKINLLNTVIRSVLEEELIVPNKLIVGQPLQNLSHSDSMLSIGTTVQVSYASDLHKVKHVMEEAAYKLKYLYSYNHVWFRLRSFDDSGITVSIWVTITFAHEHFAAQSDLNMLVWEAFRDNDIEIPFPQLDLHVKQAASMQLQTKREAPTEVKPTEA